MDTNSTPQPAATGGTPPIPDPATVDLVIGTPPVPITVWRTARTSQDPAAAVTARLAARLVAAYSRPGEAVVDLTDGHTLARACRHGARPHHPGWFTDTSLVIGPATTSDDTPTPPAEADETDPDGDVADISDWFGDDLTDPHLPPDTTGPAAVVDPGAPLTGATSLVVATWPLDARGQVANRVRLAFLLATCARLLRPGGCLVLVVASPPGTTTVTPTDFSDVTDGASRCGLGYLQHIVAVTAADTTGDEFTYHATPADLAALAGDIPPPAVHLRVHADLLVFTSIGGDQRD